MNRGPGKTALLQALVRQHQTRAVEPQHLDPVASLGSEYVGHPRIRVQTQLVLHHRGQPVVALAEIHRFARHQDPLTGQRHHHPASATAIAAIPAVSVTPSSRTVTPRPSITAEGAASTSTAANPPSGCARAEDRATSWPRHCRVRHDDNRLRGMPCRLATSVIVSADAKRARSEPSLPRSRTDASFACAQPELLRWPQPPHRGPHPRHPDHGSASDNPPLHKGVIQSQQHHERKVGSANRLL